MAEFTTVTARFWSDFTKRKNSTHTPTAADVTATDGIEINCFHKTNTSVLSPVLEIHMVFAFTFHYAYINIFQRFYYINDCVSLGANQYRLFLRCDVLGSWKNILYGKKIFSTYSDKFYDVRLAENRVIPAVHSAAVSQISQGSPLEIFSTGQEPTILSSIVCKGGHYGGVEVLLGAQVAMDFINDLADPDDLKSFLADFEGVNPFNYITGVWSVPFNVVNTNGVMHGAHIHILDFSYSGSIVLNEYKRFYTYVLMPNNVIDNDFTDSAEYLSYNLYLPSIGKIPIPTELASRAGSVGIDYMADCISGMVYYHCFLNMDDNTVAFLGDYSAGCRNNLPIAGSLSDVAQVANGIANLALGAGSTVVGAMTANPVGIAAGIGQTVGGALGSICSAPSSGVVGSFSGSVAPTLAISPAHRCPSVEVVKMSPNYNPANFVGVNGRPTNKIITLAAGIGFVQGDASGIDYAHIDGGDRVDNDAGVDKISNYHYGIYQSEIDEIISLVRGGVYFDD